MLKIFMTSPKTYQKRRDGTKSMARVGQSAVVSTQSSVYGYHVRFYGLFLWHWDPKISFFYYNQHV